MSQLKVPSNVSSVTISSTPYTPDANGIVTGPSDTDATIATDPYTRPSFVVSNPANGQCTIKMPLNISSITISSVVYNVDGNNYINAVPDVDATLLLELYDGFILVDG